MRDPSIRHRIVIILMIAGLTLFAVAILRSQTTVDLATQAKPWPIPATVRSAAPSPPTLCTLGATFTDGSFLYVCGGPVGQDTGPGTLLRFAPGAWVNGEVPIGVIDGVNTLFTLKDSSAAQGSPCVYADGLRVTYSQLGNQITLGMAPKVSVLVDYLTP